MATMNRVFLIGIVAGPPKDVGDACEFVLGVPEERADRAGLERVRVAVRSRLAEAARELRAAQPVYAEGRLIPNRGGALVEATAIVALGDPPPDAPPHEHPSGTHASPRPHDRVGHPRRLHAGTPGERVVWVRPTRVGERDDVHRRRRRRR
jgi:hypothetical protein